MPVDRGVRGRPRTGSTATLRVQGPGRCLRRPCALPDRERSLEAQRVEQLCRRADAMTRRSPGVIRVIRRNGAPLPAVGGAPPGPVGMPIWATSDSLLTHAVGETAGMIVV